jgi:hypothetical protein
MWNTMQKIISSFYGTESTSAASRHCQRRRRFFLRNDSRQHRSPRLVKGNRKEKENKKARMEAVATMMEIGYNIKDGALFGDEQDVSLGSHVSADMKNEKAVAPSIPETIINLSASPQTVLKWQPCV